MFCNAASWDKVLVMMYNVGGRSGVMMMMKINRP